MKLDRSRAFTLIEVIVAIVVMSIALLTLPLIIMQAQKNTDFSMNDDILFKLAAAMAKASSRPWDDIPEEYNSTAVFWVEPSGLDDDGNLSCRYSVMLGMRVGHVGSRLCYPTEVSATAISDANRSSIDSINDYSGAIDEYQSIKYYEEDVNLSYVVRYVEDNVTRKDRNSTDTTKSREVAIWYLYEGNEQGDGLGTDRADRTNLKRLVIKAKRQIGSEMVEIPLVYFSANIGSKNSTLLRL